MSIPMLDEEAAKSIASVLERSVKSAGDRVPASRNAKFTDMPMADNSFFMAASFCVWLRVFIWYRDMDENTIRAVMSMKAREKNILLESERYLNGICPQIWCCCLQR